jgi:hypothetical protein
MPRCFSRAWLISCVALCLAFLSGLSVVPAFGQAGSRGTVAITVLDPSGSVVPGAALQLTDISTNSVRTAVTTKVGTYSFVGLPIGTYRLTTTKSGFNTQQNDKVVVQAGQVTDLTIMLKVGAGAVKVVVSAEAVPLLQTTSTTISATINVKQLQDLPLSGRNVSTMAFLVPGYAAISSSQGTWSGLPLIAQGNSIDGVISSSSRMKFAGNAQPGPQARLDSISQMTVSTGQLSVNQGFGQAAMQSTFVTTRGTNSFHGRVYEDFRNSYLNANTWTNDAIGLKKSHLILNDFGGDIGGPILKNKLFFFGALGIAKQPGGYNHTATVLTAQAQQGIFTEQNGTQVNLFSQVAAPNGLPTTVNSSISTQLGKINGVLSDGKLSPIAGNPNIERLTWFVPSPRTQYFPTVRVDYNLSQKVRMDIAWNETKFNSPGYNPPFFPGAAFSSTGASQKSSNYTAAYGLDWTITPTLINQFRGGYFYNAYWYAYDATNAYTSPSNPIVNWAVGTSGQNYNLPITTYYPIVNFSDGMIWQKNSHTLTYGISYWREQDHYWNPPDGILTYNLGLVNGDPALTAFENYFSGASSTDRARAEALYATLVGRVSHVGPNGSGFPLNLKTGQYSTPNVGEYPLDELSSSWGLYFNDSWRVRSSLTLTYGLRWDLVNANHDLTGAYHSANLANAFGPTAPDQIFQPGKLNGVQTPVFQAREYAYQNYRVTPQPRIGLAWNPRYNSGLLGKLTGEGNTVIRASFNVRRFTEPQQYYWNAATNYGFAYYQSCNLDAINGGGAGTFPPGSLALGLTPQQLNSQYPFYCSPQSYQNTYTEASQSWIGYWGGVVNGFNYNIRQPYLEEWTLGIQRQLGRNNVLEVRYLGHHSLHEWVNVNPSEVNVFENGFLSQFKAAQTNMQINAQNGKPGTFAYNGFAGQQPLPIFEAAFSSEETSPYTAADYSNGQYINFLNTGQVGAMAATFSSMGNPTYFCNMMGTAFGPCANNLGINVPGAGYPINFFQANPYATGGAGVMADSGYGNYNAMQIDFRQNNWHGMEFDANYTWSHTLGIEPNNNWTGTSQFFTLRNTRLSYGPAIFDIRQVFHVSGTYDLPFGNGQRFLNTGNPVINRIVGGWNVGTIITYQTGLPNQITGGYNTFNDYADGGVTFNGITNNQLQSAVGVYHIPGATVASGINPSLFQSANGGITGPGSGSIMPNITAGAIGYHTWFYGPHFSNTDIAITKQTPIRENLRFVFQAEFLNAFNHPIWSTYSSNVQDPAFGNVYVSNSPRQIQLRASIDF